MDEAQAAALQLRARFSYLGRFDNVSFFLRERERSGMCGWMGKRGVEEGRAYLGLDVAHRVMLGNMQHQVLDTVREPYHQVALWRGSTGIKYIFWDSVCALLAFGFLAEGLHRRPSLRLCVVVRLTRATPFIM